MADSRRPVNLPSFSRQPGAIALDIDGTLLDSHSRLSQRNLTAVENCLSADIPVVIATSRPARAVRRLLGTRIMNTCSLVMQNGAIGIGAPPLSGKIKEIIAPDVLLNLIQALLELEPGIHITAELEGYEFGTNYPRDPASLWEHNSATPEMQLTLEKALEKSPTKLAIGGLGRDISHVVNVINQQLGSSLSVVTEANRTFANITAKAASNRTPCAVCSSP